MNLVSDLADTISLLASSGRVGLATPISDLFILREVFCCFDGQDSLTKHTAFTLLTSQTSEVATYFT
jgi:hypothetical protein